MGTELRSRGACKVSPGKRPLSQALRRPQQDLCARAGRRSSGAGRPGAQATATAAACCPHGLAASLWKQSTPVPPPQTDCEAPVTKTRCRSCRKERPYLLAARTRDCRGNGATRGLPHGVGGAGEVGLRLPRVPADEAHTRARGSPTAQAGRGCEDAGPTRRSAPGSSDAEALGNTSLGTLTERGPEVAASLALRHRNAHGKLAATSGDGRGGGRQPTCGQEALTWPWISSIVSVP